MIKIKSERDLFLTDEKTRYYSLKIICCVLFLSPMTCFVYIDFHVHIHFACYLCYLRSTILMTQWLRKDIVRVVSNINGGAIFVIKLDLRCWKGPKRASGMVVLFIFLIFLLLDICIRNSSNLQKQSSFQILVCDFLV